MENNEFTNKLILFLGICIVGLIILLMQTYSDIKVYADTIITFISVIVSLIAIVDFIKKHSRKD